MVRRSLPTRGNPSTVAWPNILSLVIDTSDITMNEVGDGPVWFELTAGALDGRDPVCIVVHSSRSDKDRR